MKEKEIRPNDNTNHEQTITSTIQPVSESKAYNNIVSRQVEHQAGSHFHRPEIVPGFFLVCATSPLQLFFQSKACIQSSPLYSSLRSKIIQTGFFLSYSLLACPSLYLFT